MDLREVAEEFIQGKEGSLVYLALSNIFSDILGMCVCMGVTVGAQKLLVVRLQGIVISSAVITV